jgi:hypothetical protein
MHTPPRSPALPFLLLAAVLLVMGLACQALVPGSQNTTPGAPTGNSPSTANTPRQPASGNQSSSGLRGSGEFNLPDPAAGLDTIENYTQTFTYSVTTTLKGQPYSAKTNIHRTAFITGATLAVLEAQSSDSQPIYRAALTNEGITYVQQAPGQPCRASQDITRGDPIPDPTLRLPPVFGAEEIGRGSMAGIPAVQYQFDQRAVRYAAGQTGTASGELWVAEDSALLLKYSLTIESTQGETPGVQTWEYTLDQINASEPISLPQGCLALPSNLPLLPDAHNVIMRPGFARYTSAASLANAAEFYRNELTAEWQEVSIDEQGQGPMGLTFTRPAGDGTQLVVVALDSSGGDLQVVIQIVMLKNQVQIDPQSTSDLSSNGSPAPTPATPSLPAALPTDLPIYPGAGDLTQSEYIILFTTPDQTDMVADFYSSEMEKLGWSLDDNSEIAGMITQTWQKDSVKLVLLIMTQDNKTQVMISNAN